MESRAKFLGHPLHQMLIAFPLGLLGTATVFDAIAAATHDRRWYEASHRMIAAGVTAGVATAIPGVIDYLAIPCNTRAKRIAFVHGIGNIGVIGLFAASWTLRRNPRKPTRGARAASAAATALALVTAWLGGELVDRLSVGVDDNAHLDASSSLRRQQDDALRRIPA